MVVRHVETHPIYLHIDQLVVRHVETHPIYLHIDQIKRNRCQNKRVTPKQKITRYIHKSLRVLLRDGPTEQYFAMNLTICQFVHLA